MLAIEWTDGWRDALLTAGRIALILLGALVLNAIARRAVRRLVRTVRAATLELDRVPGQLIRPQQLQRTEARANTLSTVLRSLASATIFLVAGLLVLGEMQINLAPLIAGAGVASIAIGFGAQSLVRDVVAGIFVLIEDQYGVGDTIDAGEASGEVEGFTLRATRLRDPAGTVWHVPNGAIVRVGNKSQNWARAVVEVTLPMDADVRRAREVFLGAAGVLAAEDGWRDTRISGDPEDQGVQAFSPQGITLRVSLQTVPAAQWAVERELRLRVKEAFDAHGIALATPPAVIPPPVA